MPCKFNKMAKAKRIRLKRYNNKDNNPSLSNESFLITQNYEISSIWQLNNHVNGSISLGGWELWQLACSWYAVGGHWTPSVTMFPIIGGIIYVYGDGEPDLTESQTICLSDRWCRTCT